MVRPVDRLDPAQRFKSYLSLHSLPCTFRFFASLMPSLYPLGTSLNQSSISGSTTLFPDRSGVYLNPKASPTLQSALMASVYWVG